MDKREKSHPRSLATSLVGAWRLESTEQRFTDGSVRPSPLYGPNGVGYLIYSASGHMCAILADPNRQRWASPDEPTETDLRLAHAHFVAYCGTYSVHEADGTVIHNIELHTTPNNGGEVAARRARVQGSRLILQPLASELPPGMVEYTLTWRRCEDQQFA